MLDMAAQALTYPYARFDLDHVQPRGLLLCVVKQGALGQDKGLRRGQRAAEGARLVRVEVVLRQMNARGFSVVCRELLHETRVVDAAALPRYPHHAEAC